MDAPPAGLAAARMSPAERANMVRRYRQKLGAPGAKSVTFPNNGCGRIVGTGAGRAQFESYVSESGQNEATALPPPDEECSACDSWEADSNTPDS